MTKTILLAAVLLAAIHLLAPVMVDAEDFVTVEVEGGDTINRLCTRLYGRCTESLYRSIKQLNPSLKRVGRIKKGDRLKFPTAGIEVRPRDKAAVREGSSDGKVAEKVEEPAAVKVEEPPCNCDKRATISSSDVSAAAYDVYPSAAIGEISQLKWLSDNSAIVTGSVGRPPGEESPYSFMVSVDGDLDYAQDLQISADGKFIAFASIGRPYDDYGKKFDLKLVQRQQDKQTQVSVTVVKERNRSGTIDFHSQDDITRLQGSAGIESWIKEQTVKSDDVDNARLKTKDGLVIRNYRFLNYNPDEKYLGRYGRVTLYGSSTIAKYLILKGDLGTAKKILDVWCDLIDANGGVPRSANVVGDTYVSPDVRTGDVAYFLGALALYKAASGSVAYDGAIRKLLYNYFMPLQDGETGLVRGGYSSNSNGYSTASRVEYVSWASSEHNFDLFQSLVLLSRLVTADEKDVVTRFYRSIGSGIDRHMWNKERNTFNRGYRFGAGADEAKALDCSSWGTLYLLKQASLAAEAKDPERELFYKRRATAALDFIDRNFKATWCYTTPDEKKGCISGYKPYSGKIDDVQDEATNTTVDWDQITDMVWSEGTLGVAIADHEMWCKSSSQINQNNCKRFYQLVDQMLKLQSLGQTGGMLYTSKRIQGHFTQGEELASLAWLGYALLLRDGDLAPDVAKYKEFIPW